MALDTIDHIVHIDTYTGFPCGICRKMVGGDLNDFEESVNHYLKEHGYKLLHVGQETGSDGEGNLWQKTAAVVGKEE
jgi:tRNA U54 and U55 pseudouridine synthase Pus10